MDMPVNSIVCGDWIKVLKGLPAGRVHCCVTSPPYWGQRNYGVEGQLGLEKTPEEHIEKLVVGFRQVRRVLRDDGVVWLNYGDKYASTPSGNFTGWGPTFKGRNFTGYLQSGAVDSIKATGLKQGDLIGLAWRLALALQADGWTLRSNIIWAKALSFCDTYSGSTMPESVNGWRWERHRIKVGSKKGNKQTTNPASFDNINGGKETPIWQDCPGCFKCEPNDGLVLRKGSWRPTRAHEYLFLLAKNSSYFCDMEAVREEHAEPERGKRKPESVHAHNAPKESMSIRWVPEEREYNPSGRNLRDVWCINPQAYPEAHYATFPEALVEPCIKAGTSEKGCCPKCGSQWARIVDTKQLKRERPADKTDRHFAGEGINACGNTVAGVSITTLGWRPTCKCKSDDLDPSGQYALDFLPVPCVVLDPFCGSGTVCAVAASLGRNYIGIELNKSYIKDQANLRIKEAETGVPVKEQKQGQIPLFPSGKAQR